MQKFPQKIEIQKSIFWPETDKLRPKSCRQVHLVLKSCEKFFYGKKTKIDNFVSKTSLNQSKRPKKRKFLKIQSMIFGRKQTNSGRYVAGRSVQSKILPKIFFIKNGQKLTILSQKNIPPPQKKRPFFGRGGVRNFKYV